MAQASVQQPEGVKAKGNQSYSEEAVGRRVSSERRKRGSDSVSSPPAAFLPVKVTVSIRASSERHKGCGDQTSLGTAIDGTREE